MLGDEDDARDDPLDDEPSGPRPDPQDRPWVHPAELQSFVATPSAPTEPPRPREWVIGIASAVAGVIATLLILVAFGVLGDRERSAIPPPVVTNPNSPIDYSIARQVSDSAALSVVTVSTNAPAQGSGIVLQTDRVVTSAHLLRGATAVEVSTKDGRELDARLIGADAATDLALLEVKGVGPELAEVARFDEPAVGDVVVALGAGRGNSGWSGMNVIQERNWLTVDQGVAIAGLLVTGIGTTPETTGGGLFDESGRLVGVLASPPGATRAGLALPIESAFAVVRQIEDGAVSHGALGVVFGDDITGASGGARIKAVLPESPAATAQPPLQPDDVVVRAGDAAIHGWQDLVAETRRRSAGDRVTIAFRRNGRMQSTVIALGAAAPEVETPAGFVG